MNTIGLIAMSAKPYHKGHEQLIRIASEECDEVHLYVSVLDRKRKGEKAISGKDMQFIWEEYLQDTLPDNVILELCNESPLKNVWRHFEYNELSDSEDTLNVYGDEDDLDAGYKTDYLEKSCPNLIKNNRIVLRPVPRSTTVNISGTDMRRFLSIGDKESFCDNCPGDAEAIWEILYK